MAEFNVEAKIDFEWKNGSVLELFRQPEIGSVINEHTKKVYNKAMAATPVVSNMRNQNYYYGTKKGGRLNLWRGRVWVGNLYSRRHNLKHNTLLKSM